MFEDATFESLGTIHTRSRNWMLATFGLNASILAALIAIPLLHPALLPQMVNTILMAAPAPVEETTPVVQQQRTAAPSELIDGRLQAPRQIPPGAWVPDHGEDTSLVSAVNLDPTGVGPGSADNPFSGRHTQPDVRQAVQPKPIVSRGVMEGMLVYRVLPVYPATARVMRICGRVELQATIARDGTIENLRVIDGPSLLRQSAYDAVKQWRYRPYLLNGDPVEVETTVNVDFRLD